VTKNELTAKNAKTAEKMQWEFRRRPAIDFNVSKLLILFIAAVKLSGYGAWF
jgi:hypothetical protein